VMKHSSVNLTCAMAISKLPHSSVSLRTFKLYKQSQSRQSKRLSSHIQDRFLRYSGRVTYAGFARCSSLHALILSISAPLFKRV
jgi:hypothetical protein